ncbi:solute carrier family 2, facilitated glucose transporter member 10 isoform X1 [Rhipicephalus sanguineus]|uniref:solute carrier family 2, facilitated glucose transporter member 10 isoform X1 n=1 Tax=Rhipicephalus sanguineus TaxID=34632 RepID=UPI001895FCB6|nr:solute carrier family 2, facilitated glucose transporter member 10 isoform X1 [Rhipicephalus sanguineus]
MDARLNLAPAAAAAGSSSRALDDYRACQPFLGSAATPKSQSVRCDLQPPKLPGNSEKEQDGNQTQTTDAKAPGVSSQSAAGAKATNGGFLPVLLAACIASLGGILFGYDSGIISGALLQIREIFDLSCVVQQLVVGSLFLSAFISSFFGGVLVDNLGRKRALLLASALFLSGSALQSLSTGLAMFVTGRFITGFAVSLSTTAQCTYIAEISPAVHRGLLMSLNEVGITVGFLMAYTVNYSFISYENGWQLMFAVATCPALLEMLGTLFLPQSPHFLVLKGRHDEARKVLNVIHGENAASQELSRMQKSLLEEQNYRYRDLFTPGMRGRMLVGVGLVILQQCTGQTNVIYYAPTLLKHLGFCTNVAATLASVGLGAVKVGAALFALLVLDRLGRRVCLCAGVILMAISIFALGMLAKYSYGGSGHSIALRCRDRPSVFNASATHYSHMTPPGYDTGVTTTRIPAPMLFRNSDVPSSPNQRHRRESDAFSSDSAGLDSSPGLSIPPPMSDQMISSGAGLMDVGYTPGRPSGGVAASSQSRSFDRAGDVAAKSSPESEESRGKIELTRDEGAVGENQSLEMQHGDNGDEGIGEEPLIELLANSTGTKTIPTATSYMVANSYAPDHVRVGKLSYMPETAAASPSQQRSPSTSSHAVAGDQHPRSEATERHVAGRTSVVAAAEESQCSGIPQGSAFQRALTLTALMCYVFAYGVSFGTTTWLILSEIFPAAVRGRAISVATSANWAANMCVSASFLTVLDNLGVGDTLLMYSGVCVLALCFIFLCVPETKHKTLEEITAELDQGLIRWRTILPTRWGRASDYTLRGPA